MVTHRLDEVRRALDDNDVFGALPEEDLEALIAFGKISSYAGGKTIFQKEDPGESLMIVLSGRVKISNYSTDGKEAVLNFIDPGQVLGEIAVLDGKARTADATAMDQTELFVLQRRDLVPFLEARPQVAIRLIEVLCAKLRRTTSMVEDVMLLNMGPRIAKMVLRLAEEHGRKRGPHIRVELKLSQRELGSHVGLARENVNRQFKQWRDEGILGLEEGCIVVYDEARLRRIADDPGG